MPKSKKRRSAASKGTVLANPRAAEAPAPPPRTSGPPLVLVVDDFQDAREMYAEYLKFSGFRVLEARTGVEALEQVSARCPDVVLMDLSLPEMDGWEATRRLKANAATRTIPVVALTGHALTHHADEARKAGCDAVVTKPCLPDALVAEVMKALERAREEDAGGSKGRR